MEGNQHGIDSSIVSKPAEKFIQIDSIFIDIFSSNDKSDDRKLCERFSIRGYVSDMRKKDRKICFPFPDLDDDHKSDKQIPLLPPIYDPNFNCRHGQSCCQENSDKGAAKDCFVSDSCHNLGNYSGVFQEAHNQGVIDGRTVDDGASPDLSCQPTCTDERENKFEVADSSTVAVISQSEPGCVSHEVTEIENLKVTEENPEENIQAGKQTPDHRDGQLTLPVSENGSMVDIDRAHYTVKFQTNVDPSVELNENTFRASESTEIFGKSLQDHHLEKLHRRKTRKIRLLTELLREDGNMKPKHVESSPFNRTPDASAKPDVRSASKCQVTIQENIVHSEHNRKKRLPQDDMCQHQEILSSCNVDKKIQTCRRDIDTPVSSSKTETENVLSRKSLQTKKGLSSRCKRDGSHTACKKKCKKSQVDPSLMSLMPSGHNGQYKIQETIGDRSDGQAMDNAAIKEHHKEFSSRIPDWNATERYSTCKNPNPDKQPLIDERPTTIFPWSNGITRKGSFTQKDVEIMKNRKVASNPFQYENYNGNERESPLSLNEYLNSQRYQYHKGIVPQGKNELPVPALLPVQDDNSRVIEVITSKDVRANCLEDSNPRYKASDVSYGRGVRGELNGKMANFRTPLPNQKQRLDPPTDIGWSQLQQKDIFSGSSGRKSFEAQEPLPLIKRHSNQRVDPASDHGTSDDIPMEIVELMAKNQYERFLHDAENNIHLSETSNCNVQMNGYGHIYRNGMGLFEKPENHRQKRHARNGGNVAISAGKFVEASKQKSADYFSNVDDHHFNMNHLQQTHMLGHNASIHSQEKLSSSTQFSTENTKYNRALESGPYNSKIRSFGGCIGHPPVLERNKEAAHIWSSMMPNHLSYGYQRVPAQSTEREKNSSPRSLHMRNVNTQSYQDHHPTNLEMHGRGGYSSEACSQKISENPFCSRPNVIELHQNPVGSLELYSNETIPAMHLLSLMDAGMQSNAPITAGGTHKLSKKPPIPRPLKGKEFSGTDIGLNRNLHAMNYPPSSFFDEGHNPEKFHYHSPAASTISASACTFKQSKGFESSTDFTGQVVLKSQNRGKTKCSDPPTLKAGHKPLKSAFRNGGVVTDTATFPVNGIDKRFVSPSKSNAFAWAHHVEKISKDSELVACAKILHGQKSTFETEICSINKNPADFSLPEAGNAYMIGAEDFDFGRTVYSKNRPNSINFNEFKRQRSM